VKSCGRRLSFNYDDNTAPIYTVVFHRYSPLLLNKERMKINKVLSVRAYMMIYDK